MGIKEALFENFHGFVEGDKNAEIMVTSCAIVYRQTAKQDHRALLINSCRKQEPSCIPS